MRFVKTFCAAIVLVALAQWPAKGGVIIVNPGFETGDFTGWTQSGDTSFTGVTSEPHGGVYSAKFGPVDGYGFITQTVATTPGMSYDLSFWIAHYDGQGFQILWGGNVVYWEGAVGSYAWTNRSVEVLADGDTTTFGFGFYNPPGFYYLDDVSLDEAGAAIPEPATALLAGLGLAAVAAIRRRRK
jgi:hypothetical protein